MMHRVALNVEQWLADPMEPWVQLGIAPQSGVSPAMDWSMDDAAYYGDVDVPGMMTSDLTVEVGDRQVRIRGHRTIADDRTWLRRERPRGSWEYTWMVPKDARVEDLQAALHDGVLSLTIPKRESVVARTIAIADMDAPAVSMHSGERLDAGTLNA
jgi:HSP20 family molecular chaperone IbpA